MFSWRAELQPGGPGSPDRLCFSSTQMVLKAGLVERGAAQPGGCCCGRGSEEAVKCTVYTHLRFTDCYSAIDLQERRLKFLETVKKNTKCLHFDTEGQETAKIWVLAQKEPMN